MSIPSISRCSDVLAAGRFSSQSGSEHATDLDESVVSKTTSSLFAQVRGSVQVSTRFLDAIPIDFDRIFISPTSYSRDHISKVLDLSNTRPYNELLAVAALALLSIAHACRRLMVSAVAGCTHLGGVPGRGALPGFDGTIGVGVSLEGEGQGSYSPTFAFSAATSAVRFSICLP